MTDYSKLSENEINEQVTRIIARASWDIVQLSKSPKVTYYDYINDDGFCFKLVKANEFFIHKLSFNDRWRVSEHSRATKSECAENPNLNRAVIECWLQLHEKGTAVDHA